MPASVPRTRGKPANERTAQPRLVEGQVVTNWKQALAQLAIAYPERINPTCNQTHQRTRRIGHLHKILTTSCPTPA